MNAISNTIRAVSVALFAAAIFCNVGCTNISSWKTSKMFSLDNTWPFRDKDKPQQGTPVRMVGTWSDTVLTQAGQKPQRGFGGRILFYEKDEKKPILVDGQLVVYAFDETGRQPTDNKPTRKYVFPPEQIPLHMSKSELGASYSFWLPWDEAGGPKTEVSLICRFEPKGGAIISSEQTKHLLPGSIPALTANGTQKPPKLPEGIPSKPIIKTLQSLQNQRTEERNARQASFETAVPTDPQAAPTGTAQDGNLLAAKRMTSTTINLPGSYQLPSAAALMNQNIPAASNPQPAQSLQQPLPNLPLPQQTSGMYQSAALAMQPNAAPQTGLSRPFAAAPPIAMMPPMQPTMQLPAGFNTMPGQMPLVQQQPQQVAQQVSLQQQLLQQQMMQQALQQRMLQAQMPAQQSAQQVPVQASGTAAVSYPPAGQSFR